MLTIVDVKNFVNVFFCYAREDEILRNELEKQLRILNRQGLILNWHDRMISPGMEWAHEINKRLNTAQIILLLLSPDFMDSDFCYSIEMKRALERHDAGEARVIPIILRAVHWNDAPFSKLQVLPTNGKPVKSWNDHDEAFLDIARGILRVIKELHASSNATEGDVKYKTAQYESAFALYEEALHIDPNSTSAYSGINRVLEILRRLKESQAQLQAELKETRLKLELQQTEAEELKNQFSQLRQDFAQLQHENYMLHETLGQRDKEVRILRETLHSFTQDSKTKAGDTNSWREVDQIMLE